jgi:hypothetical protein
VKELNVRDLPNHKQGVQCTGEIGIVWNGEQWERNGQQRLCPLSHLILHAQPRKMSWLEAAATVTGWSPTRIFAFQMRLGGVALMNGRQTHDEAKKGYADAVLYHLLHKLSRKVHRPELREELRDP